MKKVCFFIFSISSAGGTERVCTEIANKLATLDFEVTILSLYGEAPFFKLNPEIKVFNVFKQKLNLKIILPYVILKIRNKLKSISPDILVSVDSAMFVYAWLSTIGLNKKNIVWEHFNYHVSLNVKIRGVARKLAVKFSTAIVTLTKEDQLTWKTRLNCRVPIYFISNPSPFKPSAPDLRLKKPIVLSVGRLTYQKGFDRLLEVWALLKKRTDIPWELRIVGSGDMQQELLTQTMELGISGSVKLLSKTSHIQSHYQEASIYCMTSRFEGFPMVLLEAQAFGLPLVCYDCKTGPSEIINGQNGILIDDNDVAGLADSLIRLMRDDHLREKMSAASLINSSKYQTDIVIKSWLKLLSEI